MIKKIILKVGFLMTSMFLICFQYGCIVKDKYKYQAYQDMKDIVLQKEGRTTLEYFLFFQTSTKNRISYTEVCYLQSELKYSPKYKGIDIELYFKEVMMGKIILPCEGIIDCFDLAPAIMGDYKRKSFEEFIKMYATYYEEDNKYIISQSLSENEKLSVAYYFYLNNIYTIEDCHSLDFISRRVPLYTMDEFDEDDLIIIEQ